MGEFSHVPPGGRLHHQVAIDTVAGWGGWGWASSLVIWRTEGWQKTGHGEMSSSWVSLSWAWLPSYVIKDLSTRITWRPRLGFMKFLARLLSVLVWAEDVQESGLSTVASPRGYPAVFNWLCRDPLLLLLLTGLLMERAWPLIVPLVCVTLVSWLHVAVSGTISGLYLKL